MKSFLSIIILLLSLSAYSQTPQHFDGTVGTYERTLTGKGFGEDNDLTADLQTLIDDVTSQKDGGTIVMTGNIQLSRVHLKSNVHLDIRKGTVIKAGNASPALFDVGMELGLPLENIKVSCGDGDRAKSYNDISEKFTVDLSHMQNGEKARVFHLGNVSNFLIADMYVKDNYTKFSCVVLGPVMHTDGGNIHKGLQNWEVKGSPSQGDVLNCYGTKQNYGYGIIQVQCVRDFYAEKLYGIGGVTLRLESGASIQYVGTYNERELGIITGVKAKDLHLENGFSCVTLSPHGRINGSVELENINAKSSCFAVKLARGFFDKELYVSPDDAPKYLVDSTKFKKGRFDGPIVLKDVYAEYGDSAVGRKNEYDYMEQSVKDAHPWEDLSAHPDGTNIRYLFSSASVAMLAIPVANAIRDTTEGEYEAQLLGPFTSSGFQDCIDSHYGNVIYLSDKGNVSCENSNLNKTELKPEFLLYPNPAYDKLFIASEVPLEYSIHNTWGTLVLVSNTLNSSSIDVRDWPRGLYILSSNDHNNIVSKKIVLK